MPLSVPAKSLSPFQRLEQAGFSSTRSIFQDLQQSQCKDEKVLIVDLAPLAHEVQNSERFEVLNRYFPLSCLLGDCHDYDTFYSLLLDITEADETQEDKIPMATVDLLDQQGAAFVEHYRNDFIKPQLESIGSNLGSYIVKAVTPNMQGFILY